MPKQPSINAQYHGIINLMRSFEGRSSLERLINICGYSHAIGEISERNILNIIQYASIPMNQMGIRRALQFFSNFKIIKIHNQDIGLVQSLAAMDSAEIEYTEDKVDYARKEIESIGKSMFDG